MVIEFFSPVVNWYMSNINYTTIGILMVIESSFIPFPSEIVVPPAAWKAASGGLNFFGVLGVSTLGALIGALLNYFLAMFLGRPLIYKLADTKWAHLLLIKKENIEKSEKYFLKYGSVSTFIGRLVPGFRQLISLPAGLVKMDLKKFILYTSLGAGIWNLILACLGYFLYSQRELLEKYYKSLSIGLLSTAVIVVAFVIIRERKKAKANKSDTRQTEKIA
jgi:membrane protein DedA with SNARE-associated domain